MVVDRFGNKLKIGDKVLMPYSNRLCLAELKECMIGGVAIMSIANQQEPIYRFFEDIIKVPLNNQINLNDNKNKWIRLLRTSNYADDDGYECGDCGKNSDFPTKFCPHCGAEKINYETI